LVAFYKLHNPQKLGEVNTLLKKYKGKEHVLFRKLESKYRARV